MLYINLLTILKSKSHVTNVNTDKFSIRTTSLIEKHCENMQTETL